MSNIIIIIIISFINEWILDLTFNWSIVFPLSTAATNVCLHIDHLHVKNNNWKKNVKITVN